MDFVSPRADAIPLHVPALDGAATPEADDPAGRRIVGDGTPEADWLASAALRRVPTVTLERLLPPGSRAVVVAPHPDDEVLAAGGLMAMLARAGRPPHLLAVTDGTASHPGSGAWSPDRLAQERPRETGEALRRLGVAAQPVRLGLPDGDVRGQLGWLAERLLRELRAGDVVFTTWRLDGHPDHEATGHACAFAAARAGARLVEVPVWAWHWARPDDPRLPWRRAQALALTPEAADRKRRAVRAFRSQLEPDASTGAPPILRAGAVARAGRPVEVFFA